MSTYRTEYTRRVGTTRWKVDSSSFSLYDHKEPDAPTLEDVPVALKHWPVRWQFLPESRVLFAFYLKPYGGDEYMAFWWEREGDL